MSKKVPLGPDGKPMRMIKIPVEVGDYIARLQATLFAWQNLGGAFTLPATWTWMEEQGMLPEGETGESMLAMVEVLRDQTEVLLGTAVRLDAEDMGGGQGPN